MPVREYQVKVSTTGSAASATGSNSVAVPLGELVGVYLDFNASAPATTDTTITSTGGPVTTTLLTITDSLTDAWYHPGEQMDDNTGSAITGAYQSPLVFGHITVTLAGSDALTNAVSAWLYVRE